MILNQRHFTRLAYNQLVKHRQKVYIMKRMQHIRVDAFRQKTFSTPLLEIETIQTYCFIVCLYCFDF